MKLSIKSSMIEILMVYLDCYWFMGKIWKNVAKFMYNNLRDAITKTRFLQHVYKTFSMLLKGNSFQNVTFSARIYKKL